MSTISSPAVSPSPRLRLQLLHLRTRTKDRSCQQRRSQKFSWYQRHSQLSSTCNLYRSAWIYRLFTCQIQHDERQICVYSLRKRHQAHIGDQERYALQPQNVPSLSITSLSSQDPISRLRTSQPRCMFYNASNQFAIIVLSTDVHQPSRLPISSAIPMRTNSLSNSHCSSAHRKSNGARDL